jgi:hypothetical protein
MCTGDFGVEQVRDVHPIVSEGPPCRTGIEQWTEELLDVLQAEMQAELQGSSVYIRRLRGMWTG